MGWNLQQMADGTARLSDGKSTDPAFEVGRGTTDTDIVYLLLRNADGEVSYIFPNATQNGIVVQATKP